MLRYILILWTEDGLEHLDNSDVWSNDDADIRHFALEKDAKAYYFEHKEALIEAHGFDYKVNVREVTEEKYEYYQGYSAGVHDTLDTTNAKTPLNNRSGNFLAAYEAGVKNALARIKHDEQFAEFYEN